MRSFILAAGLAAASAAAAETGPYAGLETRGIAALSEADVEDLLAGRGWGFALPAELNGYPGPTHVLENAEALELTDSQRSRIEEIRAAMSTRAQALGARYVAAEAALDAAFADGTVDGDALTRLAADAAAIEAELRAAHLSAHLEVTPLLTRHQIVTYNRLRGYGDTTHGGGHGNH